MKCAFRSMLLVMVIPLAACGDDASSAGALNDTGGIQDATGGGDTSFDADAVPSDTSSPDSSPSDAGDDTSADVREVEGPLFGLKDDPTYLVPGNIAAKSDVTAAGDLVAWVEGDEAPVLVVWDVSTPDVSPRAFNPPNLAHPRALALSDAYLAFVDDRYGDPDVFAIDLQSGAEVVVVARAGAQEAPAVFGSIVAWEDCSACVTGDGSPGREPGREIIERELPDGAELQRSTDAVADHSPAYGLLADGRAALAWVSGRATLRLERLQAGVSATVDVVASLRNDQEVGRLALWNGLIAWRPSPLIVNPDSMIVNPDSMYPSDVFTTDPSVGGETSALTTHAEIAWRMDLAPLAASTRLAWLEIPPGVPASGRLMIADDATDEQPVVAAEATGMSTFAMGRDFVVFSAPRADNDGLEDVQILKVELP